MLSRAFRAHGHLCASKPWEVIIGTITFTVCLMSMGFFATNQVCGWNYKCAESLTHNTMSSDIIVLTVIRCLAVMYIYLQFCNLRKLGSKYLLGIAAVFTIFSSFVFSIAVINLVGSDLTGLHEALPFFLLLIDLTKASTLARFALSSNTQEDIRENISRGMAVIGPVITLDALVETLVIGVGTLSGVATLETMCCFGCMSVLANYLAFMTFYPACLALVLELSHERSSGRPVWQLHQLTKVLQEEENSKPNPVTQRVKLIMSGGLVLVHVHSRFLQFTSSTDMAPSPLTRYMSPDIPLWQFYLEKAIPPTLDYAVTFGLALFLAIKYVVFDKDEMRQRQDSAALYDVTKRDDSTVLYQSPVQSTDDLTTTQEPTTDNGVVVNGVVSNGVVSGKMNFIIGGDSNSDSNSDNETEDVRPKMVTSSTQTEPMTSSTQTEPLVEKLETKCVPGPEEDENSVVRSVPECENIMNNGDGACALTNTEVLALVKARKLPSYRLESALENHERGVHIRRQLITQTLADKQCLNKLPYQHYDYKYVHGACCENVIGYTPVPVGVAGPLCLDGEMYQVPMATTEGCLIASTNRGCRALQVSGGVHSIIINDGMARAPLVRFPSAREAGECKLWMEKRDNLQLVQDMFNSTSRFARLQKLHTAQAGRCLYIRFVATTGDAMGMNMLSKGSEKALKDLQSQFFPNMEIMSLSGNFCTDKKPAAINWLEGRGKSVVCEATIPGHVIKSTLKTSVHALVDLNKHKNLVGSAMAGSIGGFNAHAANVVAAVYIATGQDPAQTVCSSNCMTLMEPAGLNDEDLYITCSMPSIEVGTVGGGTILPPQGACLQMLGVRGACPASPGANAKQLARIICGTVLAGELSLMSALAAGHLVQSHLKHNRSKLNMSSSAPLTSIAECGTSSLPSISSTPPPPSTSPSEPGTCIAQAP